MGALCSARLLSPLLRLLGSHEVGADILPHDLRSADPEDRIAVELVHDTLELAAERLGNEQLGLQLGASLSLGELGPFDYLLRSARTPRDALQAAARYSALQADGYRVLFERWQGGGLIRLVDETSWPRTVAEMSMSGAYKLHVSERAPYLSRLECWFPYAAPADSGPYERAFPGATLRFSAPFHAFAFDESYERAPQPAADPLLHSMLREHLDSVLEELARSSALRHRVRLAIERHVRQANQVSAPVVARSLRMSRRTLSRRLSQEGSTFADERDAVRQELALSYVSTTERPFAEVASLLGFSHVESFHRAFKRWTGTTPLAHRTRGTCFLGHAAGSGRGRID